MRLLKPSLGECLDRLSILARKLEETLDEPTERWMDWEKEQLELEEYLVCLAPPCPEAMQWNSVRLLMQRRSLHLAAVNAMLWDREGVVRMVAESPGSLWVDSEFSVKVFKLNRRRALLVAQLSGQEKSLEKL